MVGRTDMTRIRSALLGVLLLAPGCATAPIASIDRDLTVSEGSTFQVVLDGQSGTGFSWAVDGAETGTVELLRREPLDASVERPAGVPGTGAQQTFVFLARRSGTVTLRFTHARPWETSPPPSRTYRVQVIRC
jgi:predicted secreted protein